MTFILYLAGVVLVVGLIVTLAVVIVRQGDHEARVTVLEYAADYAAAHPGPEAHKRLIAAAVQVTEDTVSLASIRGRAEYRRRMVTPRATVENVDWSEGGIRG